MSRSPRNFRPLLAYDFRSRLPGIASVWMRMNKLRRMFRSSQREPPIERAPTALLRQHGAELDAGLRQLRRELDAELRQMRLELDFVRARLSSYVGDGIALTYLVDETPIFVNSNDFGSPFALMSGGRYEEENIDVLFSFLKDDTIFLDIGANIGFFTLKIGKRLGPRGKVYAFEPHPRIYELLQRNVYVNGLSKLVTCFKLALSDKNTTETLRYPIGHLGGGQLGPGEILGHTAVDAELRRLDDLLGADFRCDLVKIDVEGHEIGVLDGMKNIVLNSPQIKILFEKLDPNAGTEAALEAYFSELGFVLYAVRPDASLDALGTGALAEWGGYVVAARPGTIEDGLWRSRFSIYGGQLLGPTASLPEPGPLRRTANQGEMLFHGPYWYLRQGVWRFKFHGKVRGVAGFGLLQRVGHVVEQFPVQVGQFEHVLVVPRDLIYFECAAYAATTQVEIVVDRLEFIREG
jgi:FkbM family methyltransferase